VFRRRLSSEAETGVRDDLEESASREGSPSNEDMVGDWGNASEEAVDVIVPLRVLARFVGGGVGSTEVDDPRGELPLIDASGIVGASANESDGGTRNGSIAKFGKNRLMSKSEESLEADSD
jgi:hypothetical protein